MRRRFWLVMWLVVLGLALAACAGPGGSAPAGGERPAPYEPMRRGY